MRLAFAVVVNDARRNDHWYRRVAIVADKERSIAAVAVESNDVSHGNLLLGITNRSGAMLTVVMAGVLDQRRRLGPRAGAARLTSRRCVLSRLPSGAIRRSLPQVRGSPA